METTESNKLIAEFMGAVGTPKYNPTEWDVYITGCLDVDSDDEKAQHFYTPDEMKYHKEWNWLMPVVEKIEYCDGISNDEVITIEYKDCIIPHHQGEVRIEGANSKLEAVYQAVVEFIKCYNQKKED